MRIVYSINTRLIKPAQRSLEWTSLSLNGSSMELDMILSYPPRWNIMSALYLPRAIMDCSCGLFFLILLNKF